MDKLDKKKLLYREEQQGGVSGADGGRERGAPGALLTSSAKVRKVNKQSLES